jgi:hypothetical protein
VDTPPQCNPVSIVVDSDRRKRGGGRVVDDHQGVEALFNCVASSSIGTTSSLSSS